MSTEVLHRPTLVLNRNWQPIHVTTVVRALIMLWNESAQVVEPDEYRLFRWEEWAHLDPHPDGPCIRTARLRLRVPEVVCLPCQDRPPRVVVSFSRCNVAKRDHYACQYCGAQPGGEAITVDHVVPRAQGGVTSWTNCVAACVGCNARKADRTPDQAGMHLRRRPTRPDWKPLDVARGEGIASWARFLEAGSALALA